MVSTGRWQRHLLAMALACSTFIKSTPAAHASEIHNPNPLELGLVFGVYIPSVLHQLYDPDVTTQTPLNAAGPSIGLRIGYMPLYMAGVEVEGLAMPMRTRLGDPAVPYAARIHARFAYPSKISPFVVAGLGALGVSSRRSILGKNADVAGHWGLGLQGRLVPRLMLRADVRHILSAREGESKRPSNHFEVLVSLTVPLGGPPPVMQQPDPPAPPPPKNPCFDPENWSSIECKTDTDLDKIYDWRDDCPLHAEDYDGIEDLDGCPDADNDLDGILDYDDECMNRPETLNGWQDEDGCPDEIPNTPVLEVTEVIYFATAMSFIAPAEREKLNDVLEMMIRHPSVILEIRGHADPRGREAYNDDLAASRADAVRDYLVDGGVERDRLREVSLGERQLRSEIDNALNRRVEFIVVLPSR